MALAVLAAGATAEVPAGLDFVGAAEAKSSDAGSTLDVAYDRATQRTIHNAYARREPLVDQLLWHGVRSLELDVHTTRAGARAPASSWFVFHEDLPLARESSCATVEACLAVLAAFHAEVPEHDVVTVFLDVKDTFGPGHTPRDLDGTVERALGRASIVAPGDVLARCPGATSVRDAVTKKECRFPGLRELRGKFVVVITGGTACQPGSAVSRYAEGSPDERLAFVAPNANEACPVAALDARSSGHVVFVNLAFEERSQAAEVRRRGLVARVYGTGLVGGLDNEADWTEAQRAGAQLLATDAVNATSDPWAASLRPAAAWRGPGARDLGEVPTMRLVEATTGDLAGERDSFFFARRARRTDANEVWSALVSVPSSHVEPEAKACLMARASDAPDAPHAALCRPFDEGAPELVVRARPGAPTVARPLELEGTTAHVPEASAFLRLSVAPTTTLPRGLLVTHVVAEASADGVSWRVVGAASVAGELPLRGVAVASRKPETVRALFGALTRSDDDGPAKVDLVDLDPVGVGSGAAGAVRPLAAR